MIEKVISGYCVLNINDSVIYAAKGYKIYKSFDETKTWELDGIVNDFKFSNLARVRLSARLFRAEITDLLVLKDGSRMLIGKKGIFVAQKDSKEYKKTFSIPRGTRPLNICEGADGVVYFGEYLRNNERTPVHIYHSHDSGVTWKICYTFKENSIRHVHGIFYDKFEDKIWFATGDLDGECIIGNTSNDFQEVHIFKEGGQKYRTVQLFFFKDFIIYGTDTEYEKNYIYKINRINGTEERMQNVQGSVMSGITYEDNVVISTTVEPSDVNTDLYSHIWFSNDGVNWKELCSFEKDFFDQKYFQYGRVRFPRNAMMDNKFYLTGHALKDIDGKTVIFKYM